MEFCRREDYEVTEIMELEQLLDAVQSRTRERSELSRGAREVGEDLAHLPD